MKETKPIQNSTIRFLLVILIISAGKATQPFQIHIPEVSKEFLEYAQTLNLPYPDVHGTLSGTSYSCLYFAVYQNECSEEMAELLSGGLASCGIAYGFMEWFIHPFSRRMFHEIAAIRANPLEFRQAVTTTDNEDAVDILCEIASLDHLPLISRIQEWVASGFDRLPPSYDSLTAVLLNYRNYLADQALKRQKQVQSIIHSISSPEDVVPLMPVHLSGPKIAEIAETVFAKFDELRTRYIERPNDLEDLLSNKENVHPVVHTLLVNLYQGALPGTICFLANAVDDPKSLPGIWLSQLDAKKS